jgi:hypothetical protein
MAKRKHKTAPLAVADSLHTAEQLTEGDRKDLWIAALEAQTAIHEANRAAQVARERDAAFKQLGMALLAKYAATGVNPSTGALTRDPPEADKG